MTEEQAIRVGKWLRASRMAKGWTLSQVAKMMDVSKVWLVRVENANARDPRADRMALLADVLQADAKTLDALAGGYLSRNLPRPKAYFRAASNLPDEAIMKIEAAVAEIQAEYGSKEQIGHDPGVLPPPSDHPAFGGKL